jgi:hypothetical protein
MNKEDNYEKTYTDTSKWREKKKRKEAKKENIINE